MTASHGSRMNVQRPATMKQMLLGPMERAGFLEPWPIPAPRWAQDAALDSASKRRSGGTGQWRTFLQRTAATVGHTELITDVKSCGWEMNHLNFFYLDEETTIHRFLKGIDF